MRVSSLEQVIGKKHGRLTGIKAMGKNEKGKILALFKCECGNEKVIIASNVSNRATKSCGCLNKEAIKKEGRRLFAKSRRG